MRFNCLQVSNSTCFIFLFFCIVSDLKKKYVCLSSLVLINYCMSAEFYSFFCNDFIVDLLTFCQPTYTGKQMLSNVSLPIACVFAGVKCN